jgi:hypothetical protein
MIQVKKKLIVFKKIIEVTTISPGPGAYEHSDTMSPSKSFIGKY